MKTANVLSFLFAAVRVIKWSIRDFSGFTDMYWNIFQSENVKNNAKIIVT